MKTNNFYTQEELEEMESKQNNNLVLFLKTSLVI